MKRILIHAFFAGVISAIACLIYSAAYSVALCVDFSKVINIVSVMATCLFGCVVAGFGYLFLRKFIKERNMLDMMFNIIFIFLTFVSCIGPFSVTLPEDLKSPELFPGLVIPMHFLPVLFWIALNPMFKDND